MDISLVPGRHLQGRIIRILKLLGRPSLKSLQVLLWPDLFEPAKGTEIDALLGRLTASPELCQPLIDQAQLPCVQSIRAQINVVAECPGQLLGRPVMQAFEGLAHLSQRLGLGPSLNDLRVGDLLGNG